MTKAEVLDKGRKIGFQVQIPEFWLSTCQIK